MLFVTFIFGTPIAIMCNEATGWWGLGLCAFAPFLVYALEIMADEMDNPFGWDTSTFTKVDQHIFDFVCNDVAVATLTLPFSRLH